MIPLHISMQHKSPTQHKSSLVSPPCFVGFATVVLVADRRSCSLNYRSLVVHQTGLPPHTASGTTRDRRLARREAQALG